MIDMNKINRLQENYGAFRDYLPGGWLVFDKGLISADEKIKIESNEQKPKEYHA